MSDPRAGRSSGSGPVIAPSGLAEEDRGPRRPPRPVLVELATALLIVNGLIGALTSIEAVLALADRGELTPLVAGLFLLLGVGMVVLGIALRYGRWWLAGVNIVAVAGFLELTSGTPQGLLYGSIDVIVVVILLANRPWFAWRPEDAEREAGPGPD